MVCSAPPTQRPPTGSAASQDSSVRPTTEGAWPSPCLSSRLGGVVFGCDPALGPKQGPSLRLGLMPRKRASLPLQTLGESLYLCSQTLKSVSSGPALDFSFSPSPTSQDTLTPGCRTDAQTLSEDQRSLNKEPVTINTVQGRGRG